MSTEWERYVHGVDDQPRARAAEQPVPSGDSGLNAQRLQHFWSQGWRINLQTGEWYRIANDEEQQP